MKTRKKKRKKQGHINSNTSLIEEKTTRKKKHTTIIYGVICFCRKIRRFDRWLGGIFQNSAFGQIILAIVLAAAVAGSSFCWNWVVDKNKYIEEINNLRLGLNQSYVDSVLGEPNNYNLYKEDEITESIYISDYAIVRCYYADGRLVAFFVTGRPGQEGVFGKNPRFERFVGNKALGDFSFLDIYKSPQHVLGSFQNGTGYMFYCEDYYYASSGLYHQYYYLMMEYGFFKCEPSTLENFMEDEEIEEVKTEVSTLPYWYNRASTYPNTYGICEYEYESKVFPLAVSYSNYDFTEYYETYDSTTTGNYYFGPYSDKEDRDTLLFFSARKPRYHGMLMTPDDIKKLEESIDWDQFFSQ